MTKGLEFRESQYHSSNADQEVLGPAHETKTTRMSGTT
jgi:hypothetical protein